MENELKDKAYEGVDGFFTKLTEAADIVTEKLIEVAPEAAQAVLNLVQFKGIFSLLAASILLAGLTIAVRKMWKWLLVKREDGTNHLLYEMEGAVVLPWLGFSLLFFAWFVVFMDDFLSFYNWLSAFYPEGAVALKALQAAGIDL